MLVKQYSAYSATISMPIYFLQSCWLKWYLILRYLSNKETRWRYCDIFLQTFLEAKLLYECLCLSLRHSLSHRGSRYFCAPPSYCLNMCLAGCLFFDLSVCIFPYLYISLVLSPFFASRKFPRIQTRIQAEREIAILLRISGVKKVQKKQKYCMSKRPCPIVTIKSGSIYKQLTRINVKYVLMILGPHCMI